MDREVAVARDTTARCHELHHAPQLSATRPEVHRPNPPAGRKKERRRQQKLSGGASECFATPDCREDAGRRSRSLYRPRSPRPVGRRVGRRSSLRLRAQAIIARELRERIAYRRLVGISG